ncbi:MAG: PilZ domain-containing protein [Gammaproteobacteria bacterium]|nr:PilZ domain-containing protein [Gammaproteobacteria bacterium]
MANPERRQHPRLPREGKVVVQIENSTENTIKPGTTVKCEPKDVSAKGLRLEVKQPVEEGCQLELWVGISGVSPKFYLAGEVKWCREMDDSTEDEPRHLIGIELSETQAHDWSQWQEVFEESAEADAGSD